MSRTKSNRSPGHRTLAILGTVVFVICPLACREASVSGTEPDPTQRTAADVRRALRDRQNQPAEAPGHPADAESRLAEPTGAPEPDGLERCGDHQWSEGGYPNGRAECEAGRVSFLVRADDHVVPFCLMSLFVLPGTTIPVDALLGRAESQFTAEVDGGKLSRRGAGSWSWTAPDTQGVYHLQICDLTHDETMYLNLFVMRRYGGEDRFHGYRIGRYERVPLNDDPAYGPVAGMVEVRESMLDEWVTPHFQLRQFLCKQGSGYPKYLVLQTRLLMKLEMLLERIQEYGVPATTLYVMSGYRTPYYNAAIGNRTRYSRHAYGDAADVFVDEDRDGVIDDLNGDGRHDEDDAAVLYAMAESLQDEAWYLPLVGGLAIYPAADRRTAFVHVDSRGSRARWEGI